MIVMQLSGIIYIILTLSIYYNLHIFSTRLLLFCCCHFYRWKKYPANWQRNTMLGFTIIGISCVTLSIATSDKEVSIIIIKSINFYNNLYYVLFSK